jgi:hypothetical protein
MSAVIMHSALAAVRSPTAALLARLIEVGWWGSYDEG